MYSFTASFRSRMNSYIRAGNRAPISDEADQLLIGGVVNRASRQTDLQRIAVNADAFGTSGIGLDMHRENGAALVVPHDGMEGVHKSG